MPRAPATYKPHGWNEKGWASRQTDYRHWYNKWIWRRPGGIREQVLQRDPLCVVCEKQGKVVPATEADHIVPHRGDWDLFVSMDNLMGLCHSCHSEKTAKDNGAFGR